MSHRTEQEDFWAGSFGDDYARRNTGPGLMASKIALLSRALARAQGIGSYLEFGPNIGLNLRALALILPGRAASAVEINPVAVEALRAIEGLAVTQGSLLDPWTGPVHDLTLAAGVLIHINPDRLPQAYDTLVSASRRYVLVAEYYNPVPVAVSYRGHEGRLFKRDFAGEMMDRHKNLALVDYGFQYRRDPLFPGDDVTWFLLEKT